MLKTIRHAWPGRYICIEGRDFSGKSTLARVLAEKLIGLGYSVVLTKEPQDKEKNIFAATVRSIYQNQDPQKAVVRCLASPELALYIRASWFNPPQNYCMSDFVSLAKKSIRLYRAGYHTDNYVIQTFLQLGMTLDRGEHYNQVIIPALKAGKIVISDRCFYSTLAYAGALGLDCGYLMRVHNVLLSTDFIQPDTLMLLEVGSEQWRKRKQSRGGEDIFENEDFSKKVAIAYHALTSVVTPSPTIIDADGTTENALAQSYAALTNILPANSDNN